jgi:uncharacterized repeat protein (TIGR03803 family)
MKTSIFLSLLASAAALQAQTLTQVVAFDFNNFGPGLVVQGRDGNFYVPSNQGNILKITPAGTFTVFYSFAGSYANALLPLSNGSFIGTWTSGSGTSGFFTLTAGGMPDTLHTFSAYLKVGAVGASGPIAVGTDGNYYGTTAAGGTAGPGTVYKITPFGSFTSLYSFSGADGASPNGLTAGSDGNLYGTTLTGGTPNCNGVGCGTVFQISTGGALTTLYKFGGGDPTAPPVEGKDGNFYGTTNFGGQNGLGTVFKITPSGTLTTLHSFDGADGANLWCDIAAVGCDPVPMVQGTDGNLYGTTAVGGTGACSFTIPTVNGCGTIFQITPSGAFSSIYSFQPPTSGQALGIDALIEGSDGNLYGTTYEGGMQVSTNGTSIGVSTGGFGTLFQFTLVSPDIPAVSATGGVLNGASFQPGISAGSWITISGTNLSSTTDTWNNSIVKGALPTTLDGVSVMVGGQPAYIEYVSPNPDQRPRSQCGSKRARRISASDGDQRERDQPGRDGSTSS